MGGHFPLPSAATQPGGAPVAQHLALAPKIAPQQSKRVERKKFIVFKEGEAGTDGDGVRQGLWVIEPGTFYLSGLKTQMWGED